MKTIFLDTNIVVDFYQHREPFFFPAATIFDLALSGHFRVCVSAATILNSFYILRKHYPKEELSVKMGELMNIAQVVDLDYSILHGAISSGWSDFEDCVQFFSACAVNAEVIVTRNPKDFARSTIEVLEPADFLDSLSN